jgi:hypothetical protein
MVPLALDLGYAMPSGSMDDSEIAVGRDDGTNHPGGAEPQAKKRRTSMFRCKPCHLRMASALCMHTAALLADCCLWQDLCSYYGFSSLTETTALYHLVEYALCELRRLLHKPKLRKESGHRSVVAQAWLDKVHNTVGEWRSEIIASGHVA